MITFAITASLYLFCIFVTLRRLETDARSREEACVASDKKGSCDHYCGRIFRCVHKHRLPVLSCVVFPVVWIYWLSALFDFDEKRERRHRKNLQTERHNTELAKERALCAQHRADEAEQVARELSTFGLTP